MPTLWWGLNPSTRWRTREDAKDKKTWVALCIYSVYPFRSIRAIVLFSVLRGWCVWITSMGCALYFLVGLGPWWKESGSGVASGWLCFSSLLLSRWLLCEFRFLSFSDCSFLSPFGNGMVTVPPWNWEPDEGANRISRENYYWDEKSITWPWRRKSKEDQVSVSSHLSLALQRTSFSDLVCSPCVMWPLKTAMLM